MPETVALWIAQCPGVVLHLPQTQSHLTRLLRKHIESGSIYPVHGSDEVEGLRVLSSDTLNAHSGIRAPLNPPLTKVSHDEH